MAETQSEVLLLLLPVHEDWIVTCGVEEQGRSPVVGSEAHAFKPVRRSPFAPSPAFKRPALHTRRPLCFS